MADSVSVGGPGPVIVDPPGASSSIMTPSGASGHSLRIAIDGIASQSFPGAVEGDALESIAKLFDEVAVRVDTDASQMELDMLGAAQQHIEEGADFTIQGQAVAGIPGSTPFERAQQLMHSCLDTLYGPAANTLNVVVRTGLIVTFTAAVRAVVAHYLNEGLKSNNVSDIHRSLATLGAITVGAGLNVMGLAREYLNHSDNLQTRMGRLGMLALTLGSGLAVGLQGGLASMTASTVSTTVYSLLRDMASCFFPLHSNVQTYTPAATAVSAGIYGVFTGMLEYLVPYLPGGGENRDSGQFEAFGELIGILPTVFAAAEDDLVLSALSYRAAPPEGDPGLSMRAGFHWPSFDELFNAATTAAALRTGAIHTINLTLAAVIAGIADDDGPHVQSQLIGTSVIAVMIAVIYGPFVAGTMSSPHTSDEAVFISHRHYINEMD